MSDAIIRVNPIEHPGVHNYVVLAGVTSPLAKVTGADREFKWQEKESKGSLGATATFQGSPLAKPTVTYTLWLPDHFRHWDLVYMPVLERSIEGAKPQALDIYSPYLERNKIKSITVVKLGQLKHVGKGKYEVTHQYLEYRPPKPGGGTPSGSKSTLPGGINNGQDIVDAATSAAEQAGEAVGDLIDQMLDLLE